MNVQWHHVISDIMVVTGQAIVRAIVAGEEDVATPAKPRDCRVKAEQAEVAGALQGYWRDKHLVALKQAFALIDAYTAQFNKCDGKLHQLLAALKGHWLPQCGRGASKRSTPLRNSVGCGTQTFLFKASGLHLTRIPGPDNSTALKVISEIGVDQNAFPALSISFTSWAWFQELRFQVVGLFQVPPRTVPTAPPRRCTKVKPHWARTTVDWAHAWTNPGPSPPAHISWRDGRVQC